MDDDRARIKMGSGAPPAGDGGAGLEAALAEAEHEVARLAGSPAERRLKQLLAVVRRALESWTVRPPAERQIAFLARLVDEVLYEARHESPTERFRRSG